MADTLDQLVLALDQISANDRNLDRFALMLIDNAIELALHRRAEQAERENVFFTHKPPHNAKHVAAAIERIFDPKAALAKSMQWISEQRCSSIKNAHRFRNSAYHTGVRHSAIVHFLVKFHFNCACELLGTYDPFGWWSSSTDVISERAARYATLADLGDPERARAAFLRLRESVNPFEEAFIADLAADWDQCVIRFDEHLTFLEKDFPRKLSRDEHLIETQAWHFVSSDEGEKFVQAQGWSELHPIQFIDQLKVAKTWAVPRDPTGRWQRRQEVLAKEKNVDLAFNKYCDFIFETENIRDAVSRSATALDREIQQQKDMRRAK